MLQGKIQCTFKRWGISDMSRPPNLPSCFAQATAGFPWFCRINPSHEDLEMRHPVSRLLFDRLPVGSAYVAYAHPCRAVRQRVPENAPHRPFCVFQSDAVELVERRQPPWRHKGRIRRWFSKKDRASFVHNCWRNWCTSQRHSPLPAFALQVPDDGFSSNAPRTSRPLFSDGKALAAGPAF